MMPTTRRWRPHPNPYGAALRAGRNQRTSTDLWLRPPARVSYRRLHRGRGDPPRVTSSCSAASSSSSAAWRRASSGLVVVAIAARRFFRKLLKGLRYVPRVLVTDKLASYQVAHRELLLSVTHRRSKYLNNRAENSHQPTRVRER